MHNGKQRQLSVPNEKVALARLHEYMARFSPNADLPIYIDEPGMCIAVS